MPTTGQSQGTEPGDVRRSAETPLERTLEQTPSSPAGTPAGASAPRRDGGIPKAPPVIRRTAVFPDLAVVPQRGAASDAPRYRVAAHIGEGASGAVYEVRDAVLERDIAMKVTPAGADPEARGSFAREARVIAGMEHPGIPPLYDMDVEENGVTYFTMKRVMGRSLRDLITEARSGGAPPEAIASTDAVVGIFTMVCDAVAYAHSKGVIHQDIKPANIMVGRYGEVLLVDWGTAKSSDMAGSTSGSGPSGTPAYMSPEQARGEETGARSDIFSIGASLFHALYLRHPTGAQTAEGFWQRRRAGELDLPTAAERDRVPPALQSIVLKAMAASPAARYASAQEMGADLRRYRAGLAVNAHRDTLAAWLKRWYRRNARNLWVSAAFLGLCAAAGGFVYDATIKRMASWGLPAFVEGFDNEEWRRNWVVRVGACGVRNGRLETLPSAAADNRLFFRQRLHGRVAFEFEGTMLPGSKPGDLSIIWADSLELNASGDSVLNSVGGFTLQVGAFDNTVCLIGRESGERLAMVRAALTPGRTYRVRGEFDGSSLRLLLNGRLLCAATTPFPLRSGHVGLYSLYPGKTVDNVRVFVKKPPELTSALELPDSYYRRGLPAAAEQEYAEIANAHPGRRIGLEARYRRGLCLRDLGRMAQAYAVWDSLQGTTLEGRARCRGLERLYEQEKFDSLVDGIGAAWAHCDDGDRPEVVGVWALVLQAEVNRHGFRLIKRLLNVQERTFPLPTIHERLVADALVLLGRHEEILRRFPGERFSRAQALMGLNRYQEVIDSFPELEYPVCWSLASLDRAEEIPRYFPASQEWVAFSLECRGMMDSVLACGMGGMAHEAGSLLLLGRGEEVLRRWPASRGYRAAALSGLGRYGEVLRMYPEQAEHCEAALLGLGHYDTLARGAVHFSVGAYAWALALTGHSRETTADSLASLGLTMGSDHAYYFALHDYLSAPAAPAMARLDSLYRLPLGYLHSWLTFSRYIMVPYLHWLADSTADPRPLFAEIAAGHRYAIRQELWHAAAYLCGRISRAEFELQPSRPGLEGRSLLYSAMRRELEGDRPGALAAYRSYSALPLGPRRWFDPTVDLFVKWRTAQLMAAASRR